MKGDEAIRYLDAGTDEIDMDSNYGFVRSGMWDEVIADIEAVTIVARPAGVLVKVIFETSFRAERIGIRWASTQAICKGSGSSA